MIAEPIVKSGYRLLKRNREHLPANLIRTMNRALSGLVGESGVGYQLYLPRFGQADVDACFAKARARFRDRKVYFLTDTQLSAPGDSLKIERVADAGEGASSGVFVCAFEDDAHFAGALKQIIRLADAFYYAPWRAHPPARYFHRNALAKEVLKEEADIGLAHFDLGDFENIIQLLEETRDIEGDYVEIGVYQGASAHLALNYMQKAGMTKQAYLLDIFEGFVFEAAEESRDATWYGTHTATSLAGVTEFLRPFPNAHVVKADITTDELPAEVKKIALCNVDVDLYEAIGAALNRVAPLISLGGAILVEDYGHTPLLGGALLATEEFLETPIAADFRKVYLQSGQLLLTRIREHAPGAMERTR